MDSTQVCHPREWNPRSTNIADTYINQENSSTEGIISSKPILLYSIHAIHIILNSTIPSITRLDVQDLFYEWESDQFFQVNKNCPPEAVPALKPDLVKPEFVVF
ncbi:predicted protein [Histoplasma capsulatum var. duboisii H88]|uniref:Predicted protein n=1 Tax=Ajellomyces capsulatus (strain H88) TaxID=544711 RepID=F0UA82_AJEC8|nr:predicted protein [Histoplasma capsulatum var. duboisii H88]